MRREGTTAADESALGLPLTLTLSPFYGERDVPCERLVGNGEVAAYPLLPASGEKVAAAG